MFLRILLLTSCVLLFANCKVVRARKLSAIEQAEILKENALLIRLKTDENKIKKLKELGMKKKAEQVKSERDKHNKEIIRAFKNNFDYAPVYFFFSYDSEKVRNGELDGIFVNETLQNDPSISFSGSFLISEFGRTQGEKVVEDTGSSSGATSGTGLSALVIMDDKFNQINKPFPYAKRVPIDSSPKEKARAVAELNGDLFYFYYEGQRWKAKKRLIEYD